MPNNLNYYLRLWNLRDPELLAQSPRSDVYAVYRNAEKAALKLLTPVGAEDESGGAVALHYFDGHGAVRLLNHDDGAHLLEYAGGEELAQMVWRGDDLAAAGIIAGVLNKLHHARPDVPPQLRTLRRRFRELFRKAARDAAAGKTSIYVRGARAAESLLANPQDECVLHGDIHHHNIRLHPVRGWLAYDPKGLYGERTYDAANTLCNPANARDRVMSEERLLKVTQALADGMGVRVGRLRAFVFAYACLSASWFGDDDDSDVKHQILTVAQNAERHGDFS
ncbi:MAG: phosphotransferase [Anaerolineae bacterium]|nr:phosphotransferase [Anaerolineae bacterium]